MRAVEGAHRSTDGGIFVFRQRSQPASRRRPQHSKSKKALPCRTTGVLQGTAVALLPLNALVGLNANQPFVLEIDRTGVAAELKKLFDVVWYLKYIASF